MPRRPTRKTSPIRTQKNLCNSRVFKRPLAPGPASAVAATNSGDARAGAESRARLPQEYLTLAAFQHQERYVSVPVIFAGQKGTRCGARLPQFRDCPRNCKRRATADNCHWRITRREGQPEPRPASQETCRDAHPACGAGRAYRLRLLRRGDIKCLPSGGVLRTSMVTTRRGSG